MIKKKYVIQALILVLLMALNLEYIVNTLRLFTNGSQEEIVQYIKGWGIIAPVISILFMMLQAFIAPIPSFLIAGANGIIFGSVFGVIISWLGGMFGAAGAFYLSRRYGSKFVRKIEKNSKILAKADALSENHGVMIILLGRLIPFVSFDFLSYAAGLSKMGFLSFIISTGIGMIPGTIAYVLMGEVLIDALNKLNNIYIVIGIIILYVLGNYIFNKSKKGKLET